MNCGLCNGSRVSGVDPCPDCAGTGIAPCVHCDRDATRTDEKGYDICGICEHTNSDFKEDPDVIEYNDPADWEWTTEEDENG